jgi:hypothetical protein
MELDYVLQMRQDKMIPMIALGIPFKMEILSKHWLSTWPMTLQSKGLVWYTDRQV